MPKTKDPGIDKSALGTWRDWLPADLMHRHDELLTRDEITMVISDHAVQSSPGDMRYWEREGILPRGVRAWHEGASRMTYPLWFVELVLGIRAMQRQGFTLAQIARFYRSLRDDFRAFMERQGGA